MIELARHIEILLLENDCVIIPGFGGFVTHHSNARRIEEEELFLPPTRTIGFNSMLKINDGLLVQSYMQAYDTNFSDASKRVEKAIEELIGILQKESKAEIQGIGEITMNINGTYDFHANEDGLLTPSLYGLNSFEIGLLQAANEKEDKRIVSEKPHSKEVYEIHINRSLLRYTAAVAAAIITFFFLSMPVENTDIERSNYAMLGSESLFESIRAQSLATSVFPVPKKTSSVQSATKSVQKKSKTSIPKELIPRSVRTEKVVAKTTVEKTTPPSVKSQSEVIKTKEIKTNNPYNIIVASVVNKTDAGKMIEQLKAKGYPSASVIEGNGRIRISLMSFSTQSEAYKKIEQLKANCSFKDAWVLTTK